jgi:ubiquinone/menaquinone biosynthesis C-methylase UbiE/protein-S-isoprenylcysteine O-methyltransferase Ste14
MEKDFYLFLIPLLPGFTLAGASAFTAAYSRRWGARGGQLATVILRNVLGIPLYFFGLVLAWRAPAPLLFDPGSAARALGWALIIAGSMPVIVGHLQLGWRTHMPSMKDTLMREGLYAHVRHPIYSGGLLIFAGLALLRPSAAFVLACALSGVFLVVQAWLEEIDLLQRLPAYRAYRQQTPGFLPRLREASMDKWAWLCPWLAVGLAAAVFTLWGLTWWTALLAAFFLVCPALIVWGLIFTRPAPDAPQEIVPATRGVVMNWQAPFYDRGCRAVGLGRNFRDATLRHAALTPGERVLDVGCGTGVLTRLAAQAAGPSGRAVGIDPAPGMIAVARENAAQTGSQAEFKLAAIEHLPFADASFDVVLSSMMLHHLPPDLKQEGLAEVYRVLKPGGRLVAVDIDRPAQPLWWLVAWPLLLMPSTASNMRGEIPGYLRAAGFEPVRTEGRWVQWFTFWIAIKGDKS